MKSNKKIEKQLKRKKKDSLVRTIILSKKNKKWKLISEKLSSPLIKKKNINLKEIEEKSKPGEKILFIGKILSQGDITKKIKIIALSFSEKAKEKLFRSGSEGSTIYEEILKNPKMEGIKIINENN